MREGYTKAIPIDAATYKSLYPNNDLPNNTFVNYENKLYFLKNNRCTFIESVISTKRPTREQRENKPLNRHQLKKKWIKDWKKEIAVQKTHG